MLRRIVLLSVCIGMVGFPQAQANTKRFPDAAQPLVRIVLENPLWANAGSGTIVQRTKDTYLILTNRHVVEYRTSHNMIVYKNNKKYNAVLIAFPCDRKPPSIGINQADFWESHRQSFWQYISRNNEGLCSADMALLKLTTSDALPVVRIRSTPVRVGAPYCAAGWIVKEEKPLLSRQCGVVTHALTRNQLFSTALGVGVTGTLLHGMSGGPMLDASGALIGLVTIKKTRPDDSCEECLTWKTTVGGSTLDAQKIELYRKSNWGVSAALACTFWSEVCTVQNGQNSKKPITRSVAHQSTTPVRAQ
ncbi:MAG: S1C family serine protease [Paenibacillaceae bacterium]|nr:S1C family serine protease [Paenibacillaceae bacterium]